MLPYIDAHLAAGGRLHQVTRHMLGLFHGRPGARDLATDSLHRGLSCGRGHRHAAGRAGGHRRAGGGMKPLDPAPCPR
jgi:hypothetical protein